jgi:hypothetical protein
METTTQTQFEDAAPSSLYGQGGAFVAMATCNLVMLVMLTACSPGTQARADAPVHAVAVHTEKITVTPSREDRPIPEWSGRLSFDDGR